MSPHREVRLKAEFAATYPGLEPDVWYPAAVVAEYFLVRPAAVPSASTELADRVLDERHFEFRGGGSGPDRRPRARPLNEEDKE